MRPEYLFFAEEANKRLKGETGIKSLEEIDLSNIQSTSTKWVI